MSLTIGHVLVIALTTALGAAVGRLIKARSRRLRYLNEVARAGLFLLGLIASVAVVVWSPGSGLAKAAMAGLYIGAVYGMVASEPRRPAPPPSPQGQSGQEAAAGPSGGRASEGTDASL